MEEIHFILSRYVIFLVRLTSSKIDQEDVIKKMTHVSNVLNVYSNIENLPSLVGMIDNDYSVLFAVTNGRLYCKNNGNIFRIRHTGKVTKLKRKESIRNVTKKVSHWVQSLNVFYANNITDQFTDVIVFFQRGRLFHKMYHRGDTIMIEFEYGCDCKRHENYFIIFDMVKQTYTLCFHSSGYLNMVTCNICANEFHQIGYSCVEKSTSDLVEWVHFESDLKKGCIEVSPKMTRQEVAIMLTPVMKIDNALHDICIETQD